MDGIPPARDTDAEDVVWALQTAEALWKRNERGDAIVWLRRAAQAAGEAETAAGRLEVDDAWEAAELFSAMVGSRQMLALLGLPVETDRPTMERLSANIAQRFVAAYAPNPR